MRNETQAYCLGDVRFESADRRRYSAAEAAAATTISMVKCWIKFRTKKNGQKGDEKLLRIIPRYIHLQGANDTKTPLAMYQPAGPSKGKKLITALDIEEAMRRTAGRVYQLDHAKDKQTLQKWSAHSLRVGACVIVHSLGMSIAQIKFLLRWRSDAFMVYLRTAILSDSQNVLFNAADAMPNFL
jgi:hypothetical protein